MCWYSSSIFSAISLAVLARLFLPDFFPDLARSMISLSLLASASISGLASSLKLGKSVVAQVLGRGFLIISVLKLLLLCS